MLRSKRARRPTSRSCKECRRRITIPPARRWRGAPAVGGLAGRWIAASRGRIVKLAVAALILVAAGVLFDHLLRPLGGAVAWAEVTRRFQAVPFFSAAIYMKEDATSEPTQMELWMIQDGRIRLRIGTQVVFARGGAALDR